MLPCRVAGRRPVALFALRFVAGPVCAVLLCGTSGGLSASTAAELPGPQTYGAAMSWYQRAAEDGDADAQYLLGLKYRRGIDRPADSARAASWFAKAAEQGHAEAQFTLATMYASGDGVAVDAARAAYWFEQSAVGGLAAGQYNLGVALLNGAGVVQDVPLALAWLSIAAESGLSDAMMLRDRVRQSISAETVESARLREAELRKKYPL